MSLISIAQAVDNVQRKCAQNLSGESPSPRLSLQTLKLRTTACYINWKKHGFDFEHCAYMLSEFRALVAGHFAKESVLSVAHVELLKYLLSE